MARPDRTSRCWPGRRRRRAAAVAATAAALLLAACGVPVPEPPGAADPAPVQGGEGLELTAEDPAGAALVAQLAALDAAVAAVAAALADAATAAAGGDAEAARAGGATAVDLLLGAGEGPGLLPTTAVDRAGGGAADLVTATVTRAGDVGGERARIVLELVRDPLVGDLGAWQRDAPGVIAAVRTTVAGAGADAAALDAGLGAVAGELTRALGYALAVAAAPDAALADHAARAGAARLEVVRVAIELGAAAVADGDGA